MADSPIVPGKTAEFISTEGEAVRFGERLVKTPRGVVKCDDAPGYTTCLIEHPDPAWRRIGFLLYAPGGDYAGAGTFALGVGKGMIAQLTADQARLVGNSLLRLADTLDSGGSHGG